MDPYYEKNRERILQYHQDNKDDRNRIAREKYRATGNVSGKNGRYLRKYGISYNDYHEMLVDQKQCCAICLTPLEDTGTNKGKNKPVIDR